MMMVLSPNLPEIYIGKSDTFKYSNYRMCHPQGGQWRLGLIRKLKTQYKLRDKVPFLLMSFDIEFICPQRGNYCFKLHTYLLFLILHTTWIKSYYNAINYPFFQTYLLLLILHTASIKSYYNAINHPFVLEDVNGSESL